MKWESLSWNLRSELAARDETRLFEELARACRDICSAHFLEEEGYAIACARLSGPFEGLSITVSRGQFEGLVSLQKFCHVGGRPKRAVEFRVVAAAKSMSPGTDLIATRRGGWGAAGYVAGLATLALGLTAVAPAVGQAALGVLTAWGVVSACRATRQPIKVTQWPATSPVIADEHDRLRWTRLLGSIHGQRSAAAGRLHPRFFRGESTALIAAAD